MNALETLPVSVVAPQLSEDAVLPPHLVELSRDDGWALWRNVCLRGAGFPATEVLKLSTAEGAAAADQLLDAEERVEQSRVKALKALQLEVKTAEPSEVPQLEKLIQRLRKKKRPAQVNGVVAELSEAYAALDAALEVFHTEYKTSIDSMSQALHQMAGNNRFREAVLWQNRHAIRSGVDALLREAPRAGARGSKQRQHEELVANYLQRYCVKNDTIGFFGPVGWAQIVSTCRSCPTLWLTPI